MDRIGGSNKSCKCVHRLLIQAINMRAGLSYLADMGSEVIPARGAQSNAKFKLCTETYMSIL